MAAARRSSTARSGSAARGGDGAGDGLVAILVYDKWGVAILRKAWINLDGVWAGAFVLAGVLTFFT